jgi:O-succinylbenzoate synthase
MPSRTEDTMTGLLIERAEIHLVELPLKFRFETSFGVQTARVVPIVVLHGADGSIGLAEGVMDSEWPLYREETVEGAVPLVRRMLEHFVVGRSFETPADVTARFAHLRGNRMAKAMIEMAVWDLFARSTGRPLRDVLGGAHERVQRLEQRLGYMGDRTAHPVTQCGPEYSQRGVQ